MTPQSKWIGVVRLGGIGDLLIASSVMKQFKALGYMTEFICQTPFDVVLQNNPYIDKLSPKDNGDLPQNTVDWQNWFRFRAKEYAQRENGTRGFYNLSTSAEFTLALDPQQQTAAQWPPSIRRELCGRSYLEFTHDICEVPRVYLPRFYPTDQELYQACETKATVGERVIGWVVAGSRIDKIHPYSAMMIARLIKEVGPVIMFGAPTEKELTAAKSIEEQVKRQNGTSAGLHSAISVNQENHNWPIRRGLTQLQLCDLVIGPDTGAMWSVSMADMPKIVMLGHASPRNITHGWMNTVTLHAATERVPCWPCHMLHISPDTCVANSEQNGAACISDISAEMVLEQAARLWKAQESADADGCAVEGERERARDNGGRPARERVARGNGRADGHGEVPAVPAG